MPSFNWKYELGKEDYKEYPFQFYENMDFMAPFASGSAKYETVIICPCSMGVMGRIATGVSTDLITRAGRCLPKGKEKTYFSSKGHSLQPHPHQ